MNVKKIIKFIKIYNPLNRCQIEVNDESWGL